VYGWGNSILNDRGPEFNAKEKIENSETVCLPNVNRVSQPSFIPQEMRRVYVCTCEVVKMLNET
jgi:hypothetical protein